MDVPGLRGVLNGAKTLFPSGRWEIEQEIGAALLNCYGNSEGGPIAWECLKTGLLHMCDDAMFVEILDGGESPRPWRIRQRLDRRSWEPGLLGVDRHSLRGSLGTPPVERSAESGRVLRGHGAPEMVHDGSSSGG